jgi:hypothetical protein
VPITYDPRASQYRDETGQFVSRARVMQEVEREILQVQVRSQAHTRLLIEGKIHLAEWQLRMAETIKDSHIRMGALASGGTEQLTQKHYGAIGYQLKRQYEYLDGFARDLYAGKLTPKQALRRSALYAESVKATFSRSEQITRVDEGLNVGKRLLDSQANHCDECLEYQRTSWARIEEIVPIGTNCSCQNRCRCRIVWGRIPLAELISARSENPA